MLKAQLVRNCLFEHLAGSIDEGDRNDILGRILRDPRVIGVELAHNLHGLGSLSVIRVERDEESLVSALEVTDDTAELCLREEEVVGLVGVNEEMVRAIAGGLGHRGWLDS